MKIIKGICISPGVAIGPVYRFEPGKVVIPQTYITDSEVESELEKFRQATDQAATELEQVRDLVLKHLDEEHARLIDAQLIALTDVELTKKVTELIRREHRNVLWAYFTAMEWYETALANSASQFQQERLIDLQDIKKRTLQHLTLHSSINIPQMPAPAICVSERISPSELIQLHNQNALGIITKIGGMDSHVGILARAFGIPYMSNIEEIEKIGQADKIILDAEREVAIIDARPIDLAKYETKAQEFNIHRRQMKKSFPPAISRDGVEAEILLNAGFVSEIKAVNPTLIKGIGLFRTEYLCLERDDVPGEEEQFKAYRQILTAMKGKPTTFRTFDFGREKMVSILDLEMFQHDATFDTWGGIGFCLDNPWILKTQLRALLRASQYGPLKIMFPLVLNKAEIHLALKIYREVQRELKQENQTFDVDIPLGAMIETKSILDELEELTTLLDFFSVGTNDLALFLLGSKRADNVSKNYYQPIIFQAIDRIAKVGQPKAFSITICGEMASDPLAVLGLLALGIRSFSMSASALIAITDLIRRVNIQQIGSLRDDLLSTASVRQTYKLLRDWHRRYTKGKHL